jgi:hypothetical protein
MTKPEEFTMRHMIIFKHVNQISLFTGDEVILNLHVPRVFTEETIEIAQREAYFRYNRPLIDINNWNPSLTPINGPFKGWSYACLHVLIKTLVDEVAGLTRNTYINWKEALNTVHVKALAIAAFNKEVQSLT